MITFTVKRYVDVWWFWSGHWGDQTIDSCGHDTRDAAVADLEQFIEACRTGQYVIEEGE